MYIPIEVFFAIVTTGIAFIAYKAGTGDRAQQHEEVVESTIDYLIAENMIKWKRRSDGEIELISLDDN